MTSGPAGRSYGNPATSNVTKIVLWRATGAAITVITGPNVAEEAADTAVQYTLEANDAINDAMTKFNQWLDTVLPK